jgi:type IV pilus assembly protein PilM
MGVGLDIGSKTIKIVDLEEKGTSWKLKASGVVGYRGNTPEHMKTDKEYAPLAEVIKKLHKEARISSKEIALALPEPQVYTRTIKFPLLTDAEIASAVKWEAEQYIPIPISEAIIQHQIIERLEDMSPPQVSLLLIAAPKLLVEKYAKVVDMAGLNLVVLETELMALVRSLAPEGKTVLLADFGARATNIAIAKNQVLAFSRSIHTAGEALTRAVSQYLGVEEQQAEEYKKTYGLSQSQLEGKIKVALDPVFSVVADEMRKAIQFYQAEEKGETPKVAILSGGTAGMPDAVSALTKLLNMEVLIGNPFARVEIDPQAQSTISGYSPLYAVAAGLAMRKE